MTEHYQQDQIRPRSFDLWQFHQGRGDIAKAFEQYEQAATEYWAAAYAMRSEQAVPSGRLHRAYSIVARASVFILMERYDEALSLLKEARVLRDGITPDLHTLTAEINHLAAIALTGLKRYEEACWHYQLAYECLIQLVGREHKYAKNVFANWTTCYHLWRASNGNGNPSGPGQTV